VASARTQDSRPPLILGLALSTHPGPALAVTVVTIVLGLGAGLDAIRVSILGIAMLLDQASVGLSNDWIDAERDRLVGRTDKPVARGWVSVQVVRALAITFAIAAIALTVPLGIGATLAHAVALGSAWSYNAWLKKTPASVLPFALSFGLLPLIVSLSRPEPSFAAPWAIGAGALLGVAAHFSNVLPDFADDRATGIRGLPHLIGRRFSGLIIAVALAAGSALIVFSRGVPVESLLLVAFALTTALAATAAILAIVSPPRRILFQIIIVAALLNVVVLAFGGTTFYR
jgi:4-hydroxybenzoate polyprenyltransferase